MMRCDVLVLLVLATSVAAQTPTVVAGWNRSDPGASADGQPALRTRLRFLSSVTVDRAGRVTLIGGDKVRQITSDGRIATLSTDSGMGTFTHAAVDAAGNIYYTGLLQLHKVSPEGTNVVIAGGGGDDLAREGVAATSVRLQLTGVAVSAAGEVFFSDFRTLRVWRIDSAGLLHVVAGTDMPGTAGEGGPATSAQLQFAGELAFDAAGALYIADDARIVKVRPDGILVRVSGSEPVKITSLTVDPAGNVYFSPNFQIFRIATDGTMTTVAGTGEIAEPSTGIVNNGCGSGARPDLGDARTATFGQITSLAVDPNGNLLAVDQSGSLLRSISPSGEIRTVAGAPPSFGGDGGPARDAILSNPDGLAFDAAGNLYIADRLNNRIRRVGTDGIIQTVAGDGGPTADMEYACSGASDLFLKAPEAVAVDSSGNLYIADTGKHRVLKLAPGGSPARFAGTGQQGFAHAEPGDAAGSIPLDSPHAVGIDRSGNIYVGDNASRTLKLSPEGKVLKVIPELRAQALTNDAAGNLYVTANFVSSLITPDDELLPIAGLGPGPTIDLGDPPPLDYTDRGGAHGGGLTRDSQGTFYHLASANANVDVISPSCHVSSPPVINPSYAAGAARLTANASGDVFVSDAGAGVVWQLPRRQVEPADTPTPTLAIGAAIRNAASQLVMTRDVLMPTGGFTESLYRFLLSDFVAPGELVRIEGQCLGPFDGANAQYDESGHLPTSLAGTRVWIGGLPAPLISVEAGRITAIAPLALEPNAQVDLEVDFDGGSTRATISTAPLMPGLFQVVNPDGSKSAVALNQDGTLNTRENPAPAGSIVSLWGTGFGQTEPPAADGVPATGPGQKYGADVQVTVNGAAADVLYAGPAPGFVGLTQINVRVSSAGSGSVGIAMGGAPFRQVVSLWVR